ncbi:hypothetical protein N3K66_003569 [Trichothecium roseum]|uniref:Uncharacterized protein n=1 Tax=Trichothecium roseum TaxID=47278 RepID=A0ACC0V6I1_9HYPO|nr:hypothetical protein N3K66_003569 [Trichothecium roseum]
MSTSTSDEESRIPKLKFRVCSDGMPKPGPPASFPQFGLLPPELRLKVWENLLQPRVVVVTCIQRDDILPMRESRLEEELQTRAGGAQVPVLLHINREARTEALKHYEVTFAWKVSNRHNDAPVHREARIFFNYDTDALFLTGNLEAYDTYGFNQPMVYFLRKDDTIRVKHIACAFKEIGHGRSRSDTVFGCLWHIVDRFPRAKRLILTVSEGDEEAGSVPEGELDLNSVVHKLWNGWMGGMTVTSTTLSDKQMLLIREDGLAEFIQKHRD